MDLSEEVLNGLHVAGENVHIPDKSFVHMLKAVSESLIDSQHFDIQGKHGSRFMYDLQLSLTSTGS